MWYGSVQDTLDQLHSAEVLFSTGDGKWCVQKDSDANEKIRIQLFGDPFLADAPPVGGRSLRL